MDFFVGFHDAPGSGTLSMAVFATTDCNNIPFGGADENFGCPTNGPGWVKLGEMVVSGENEWKNVVFNFTADQAYEAIVVGPACDINPNFGLDPYFYFDRLVLAQASSFDIPLEVSGFICRNNLVITSTVTTGEFQWYKDGVAIDGETGVSLSLLDDGEAEGIYEVVVTSEEGCFNSEQYEVVVPLYQTFATRQICEGESFTLGPFTLTTPGEFSHATSSVIDGCDSISRVRLFVNPVQLRRCNNSCLFWDNFFIQL